MSTRTWWMPSSIAGLLATVALAVVAGFGEWSAPAIYAGMALVAFITFGVLRWTDRAHVRNQ